MNQQRARRFRSAMDAKERAEKAERAGTVLPTEAAFDSNCITPGTPFMERLQAQLKYYINKKISEDSAWRNVTVILSGQDVPGEGEHKIMEFIRNTKAAPGYDNNTRHCLYGLDADLVMLGLLSHEPHFSLLREEVTFGRKPKKTTKTASEQNFYLLHLSLMREYLSFEFAALETSLPFPYEFEKVLDDFVLICFFVGNDFLPHLPGLHINEGGLATLFEIYKEILPRCSGYLNQNGFLNVQDCQLFFSKLEKLELEEFQLFQGNASWMEGKRKTPQKAQKPKMVITPRQEALYQQFKAFLDRPRSSGSLQFSWSKMPAADRAFALQLIASLGLDHEIDAGEFETILVVDWDEDDDESDEESLAARQRVIKKYDGAERTAEPSAENTAKEKLDSLTDAIGEWKRDYYKEKLEFVSDYDAKVDRIVYHYVEGLQWVLLYYYHGVPSWEWFFPYHYAPKISDLKSISELKFEFDLGYPFNPFEQLMAVLPPLSRQHVPPSLQDLMTDAHSPIIDFYPATFELDMNGKKADWEAIVKIPFIDEKRLLRAIHARENSLTKDEKRRNARGHDWSFVFQGHLPPAHYPSPLPAVFPDIFSCYCHMGQCKTIPKPREVSINHLCPNALLGRDMLPGFPSMYTIPFTTSLGYHGVNVFNSESKNPSHVVSIQNIFEAETPESIAQTLIGNSVFTAWPFLIEARVQSVADEYFVYQKVNSNGTTRIKKTPHNDETASNFGRSAERSEKHYSRRFGVLIGTVDMVAKLETLVGMQLLNDGSIVKEFKVVSEFDTPVQLLVLGNHFDPRFSDIPCPPIELEFPLGSPVFFLAQKLYGSLCEVVPPEVASPNALSIRITQPTDPSLQGEPQEVVRVARKEQEQLKYFPGWQIAKRLKISALALSKITSSMQVTIESSAQKINLGLNLKYDSRGLKVLGYSQKTDRGWEYSQRAITLIEQYRTAFPTIFSRLDKAANSDYFKDTDFFASPTKESIAKVQQWLSEKGVKQFLAVSLASSTLTKETVAAIERIVDEHYEKLAKAEYKPLIIKSVPRSNVLKPAHSVFRLGNQNFAIGDRVVSTVDYGRVPVGFKGTVIGLEGKTLDILWDLPVMGGSSLEGLCSPDRGTVADRETVLNLSNVQPPISATAPKKQHQPKQRSMASAKRDAGPPQPMYNQWTAGAPKPRPEGTDPSTMLKNLLHIGDQSAAHDGAVYPHYGYGYEASSGWQPPVMMHYPNTMAEHLNAPAFIPAGPSVYDSSWQPSMPVPVSVAPEQYDEMSNRLLSILHQQNSQPSDTPDPQAAPSKGKTAEPKKGKKMTLTKKPKQ
ncbi:hypothetical protein HDU91_003960 [Kappamyces sp. JEL0680]|nr:hypothetical protein HDU91_003960 [Kappamyces sp. JEL0680]